jgi:putative twin-arginine translocation pathway signal
MVCLLLGCSHPKQPQRTIQNAPITRIDAPNDSAIVAQRVTEIYGFLCKSMNDSNVEAPDGAAFERRFCSRAWNEESKKVAQIDARHPGEIGLWDYGYWIQAQDYVHLSFRNVRVVSIENHQTARVKLILHNGEDVPLELKMVKEQGQWRIDDLTDASNPHGIRATQAQYIRENP